MTTVGSLGWGQLGVGHRCSVEKRLCYMLHLKCSWYPADVKKAAGFVSLKSA